MSIFNNKPFPNYRFFMLVLMCLTMTGCIVSGQITNSLTGKGVEGVIIELQDYSTDKVIESRITDNDGNYLFFITHTEEKKYRLVSKHDEYNFFPSLRTVALSFDTSETVNFSGEWMCSNRKQDFRDSGL